MVAIPGFYERPQACARRFEVEDLARSCEQNISPDPFVKRLSSQTGNLIAKSEKGSKDVRCRGRAFKGVIQSPEPS
jgi:hypothetical protein